jgi:hypothetical protein
MIHAIFLTKDKLYNIATIQGTPEEVEPVVKQELLTHPVTDFDTCIPFDLLSDGMRTVIIKYKVECNYPPEEV